MSGETHFDFTANRNGHDSPAPGNLGFNQIDLHRIDKRQKEVIEKKDGTLVATVRESTFERWKGTDRHHYDRRPSRSDHRVDAKRRCEGRH